MCKNENSFLTLQDMFDHDKGQKSAILGAVSTGFFEVSPVDFIPFLQVYCVTSKLENIARFPSGEKSVESCHVCGCHGFFSPEHLKSHFPPSVGIFTQMSY